MSKTYSTNEIIEILKEQQQKRKRKPRKFYWNRSIQSEDKDNGINAERRKFSPTILIISSEKRTGIQKKIVHFDDDADFNEYNN